jgi:translation elongation factor EF-1beta
MFINSVAHKYTVMKIGIQNVGFGLLALLGKGNLKW